MELNEDSTHIISNVTDLLMNQHSDAIYTDVSLFDLISEELVTMAVRDIEQFRRVAKAMVTILQTINKSN
jgi:hypothetical protein